MHWRHLHSIFQDTTEEHTTRMRISTIKPEGKFIEIIVQMGRLDASLVRPEQPTFQQGDDQMHMRQQIIDDFCSYHMMGIAFRRQAVITRQSISLDITAWRHGRLQSSLQGSSRTIRDAQQADTPQFSSCMFDGDQDNDFACRTAATFSGLGGAPIRLVDLHEARQSIPIWAYHRSAQAMQPCPGRVVTAEAQNPLHAQRAGAVFLANHIADRLKPDTQRKARILKERFLGWTKSLVAFRPRV